MKARIDAEVLAADLAEGLSAAQIAERRGVNLRAAYRRVHQLGLKLNSRRKNGWSWLADDLKHYRVAEIAVRRGISQPMLNAAINEHGLRYLVRSQRRCDYDAVLADLATGLTVPEVAAAQGVSRTLSGRSISGSSLARPRSRPSPPARHPGHDLAPPREAAAITQAAGRVQMAGRVDARRHHFCSAPVVSYTSTHCVAPESLTREGRVGVG
jgi:hypothetical protein